MSRNILEGTVKFFKITPKHKLVTILLKGSLITLSKNGIKLSIFLYPKRQPQCGGPVGVKEVRSEKLSSDVDKIFYNTLNYDNGEWSKEAFVKYGSFFCVSGNITTNLNALEYSDYKAETGNQNDDKVIYTYSIELSNGATGASLKENDPIIKEIDQIFNQSSFN